MRAFRFPTADTPRLARFPHAAALPVWVVGLFVSGTVACGHTQPESETKATTGTTTAAPIRPPELIGARLSFEWYEGYEQLVARAVLGDADDNLVPGGVLDAWLFDDTGAERTHYQYVKLGTDPAFLVDPFHLEVPFRIANDPTIAWRVELTVVDRDGNSSETVVLDWLVDDTGL